MSDFMAPPERILICSAIIFSGAQFTPFPGRSAARSDALQTRDRYELRVCGDPGSAVHRYASLRAAPHPGKKEERAANVAAL
jgi:hypothetical protein